MIELLISILLLSSGIIGVIKMQVHSIQASQQSHFYSKALELASEIAEKMRNNHAGRLPASNPFLTVDFQSDKDKPDSANTCFDTHCKPEQLAHADIAEWLLHLNATLPNAHAVICLDSAPWNVSTNNLTWDCASADDNASVVIKLGWTEQNEANTHPPPRLAVAVIP